MVGLGVESPDGSAYPDHDRTDQIQGLGYLEQTLNESNRVRQYQHPRHSHRHRRAGGRDHRGADLVTHRSPQMNNRRDVLALGAGATAWWAARGGDALAQGDVTSPARARLETRLFNLNDSLSPDAAAEIVATFTKAAKEAATGGVLVGRNLNDVPFATRFEWIYMIQFAPTAAEANNAAFQRFEAARALLATQCRNVAACTLDCDLPPRFAAAPNVKVRHTVMFSFKTDASAEDRARNVASIRNMGRLPMVRSYLVQSASPNASGPDQMQWQVIGDFDSLADYQAYATAPVHLQIGTDFKAHTSRVAFLDVFV